MNSQKVWGGPSSVSSMEEPPLVYIYEFVHVCECVCVHVSVYMCLYMQVYM